MFTNILMPGGPLQCDGNLVGIVSYGTRVCAVSMPDVYTRASEYVGKDKLLSLLNIFCNLIFSQS